uniref:Uncharacterized protein n=1 Tax=Rhizophora mucronata TaxID=61149 RepID=A0A2P2NJ84_RHIMU
MGNLSHLPMITTEASSSLIGTTTALMNKPRDYPLFPLFGLESLSHF